MRQRSLSVLTLAMGLIVFLFIFLVPANQPAEQHYYLLNMAHQPVGYGVESVYRKEHNPFPSRVETRVRSRVSLLGSQFDPGFGETIDYDPLTGRVTAYHLVSIGQPQKREFRSRLDADLIRYQSHPGADFVEIERSDDLLIERDWGFYTTLLEELGQLDVGGEISRKVFDHATGKVVKRVYRMEGWEEIDVQGQSELCLVAGILYPDMQLYSRMWFDDTARMVKMLTPDFSIITKDGPDVADKVVRVDADPLIFHPVDAVISDVRNINYMRVEASIRTANPYLTPTHLNVPGQMFRGTVANGMIKGVFELEYPRYYGAHAPVFPPCFDEAEEKRLARWLKPEYMIESDDPTIVAKARELTDGATDSWDAATRISDWVSQNITYGVTGGSAAYTLAHRKGECGAFSRLYTALCRAAGIPARLVAGYMMTPSQGGSFGQHGWNEVYMGSQKGWVTLDTTAGEKDYVDSGHIRLGYTGGFLLEEARILDYCVGERMMHEELQPLALSGVPFKAGDRLEYEYRYNHNYIGRSRVQVQEDGVNLKLISKVSLGRDESSSAEWLLDPLGNTLAYQAKGRRDGKAFKVFMTVDEGEYTWRQEKEPMAKRMVAKEPRLLLETLQPLFFGLMIARHDPEEEAPLNMRVWMPREGQYLAVSVSHAGEETIPGHEPWRVSEIIMGGTTVKVWTDKTGLPRKLVYKGEGLMVLLQEQKHAG